MAKIIESSQLPFDDKVYMKKDIFGWRVVQPIKNPDGSYNWWNLLFGGKRNALFLLGILFVVAFLMYSHYHDVKAIQDNYQKIADNPFEWCRDIKTNTTLAYEYANKYDINFSKLEIIE